MTSNISKDTDEEMEQRNDAGMGAYLHNLQSSTDIGTSIGTAAASCYNSLVDNGVPEEYAVSLTETFLFNFFDMITTMNSKKPGENSLSAKP